MEKLNLSDKVLYWDGNTTLELTEVIQVNKENSTVKLSNGVVLYRKPSSEGIYNRADYRESIEQKELNKKRKRKSVSTALPISKSWKYGTGDTERIWKAYQFKRSFANVYDKLKQKVTFTSNLELIFEPEALEFIEKVERKMNKLV